MESKWNTNFDELPEDATEVLVQHKGNGGGECRSIITASRDYIDPYWRILGTFIAWHPMPEPYRPPKPEQISSKEADRFRLAQVVEDSSPVMWVSGETPMEKLIKAVEERTREIVAWESKYE